jgi:hypothetical protein
MLPLKASDHTYWLTNNVEIKVFEIVVWGKRKILVDIILVTCPEADINVRFVPPHLFDTLEARIYVLQYVDDIVRIRLFRPKKLG